MITGATCQQYKTHLENEFQQTLFYRKPGNMMAWMDRQLEQTFDSEHTQTDVFQCIYEQFKCIPASFFNHSLLLGSDEFNELFIKKYISFNDFIQKKLTEKNYSIPFIKNNLWDILNINIQQGQPLNSHIYHLFFNNLTNEQLNYLWSPQDPCKPYDCMAAVLAKDSNETTLTYLESWLSAGMDSNLLLGNDKAPLILSANQIERIDLLLRYGADPLNESIDDAHASKFLLHLMILINSQQINGCEKKDIFSRTLVKPYLTHQLKNMPDERRGRILKNAFFQYATTTSHYHDFITIADDATHWLKKLTSNIPIKEDFFNLELVEYQNTLAPGIFLAAQIKNQSLHDYKLCRPTLINALKKYPDNLLAQEAKIALFVTDKPVDEKNHGFHLHSEKTVQYILEKVDNTHPYLIHLIIKINDNIERVGLNNPFPAPLQKEEQLFMENFFCHKRQLNLIIDKFKKNVIKKIESPYEFVRVLSYTERLIHKLKQQPDITSQNILKDASEFNDYIKESMANLFFEHPDLMNYLDPVDDLYEIRAYVKQKILSGDDSYHQEHLDFMSFWAPDDDLEYSSFIEKTRLSISMQNNDKTLSKPRI